MQNCRMRDLREECVDSNENQPGGSPDRTITIRLTRDTLILIAALTFLGLAIVLAVLFPPGGPGSAAPTSTAFAHGNPTVPVASRATAAAPTSMAPTSPALGGAMPTIGPTLGAYPGPETPAPSAVEEVPGMAGPTSPATPIASPPAFLPTRTTQGPAGGTPTAASSGNQQPAYPPPETSTPESGEASDEDGSLIEPTEVPTLRPQPSAQPQPQPQPTSPPRPRPTSAPAGGGTEPPRQPAPTTPPLPTPVPMTVLRGTVHWTAAQSPILLTRDQQLAPGATLLIEPGVEVRLAPGVSFFIDGTLYALGQPDRPVRFVGSENQRWEGLFGRPGSNIAMEHTEIRGGGAGGTVLASEGGNLVLRHAHINDNGGHIQVIDSHLEMRDSEIAGNDMPYGAALDVTYNAGGNVTLTNNRIGGNRMSFGSAAVQIANQSPFDAVDLDLQGNLILNQEGPNLVLSSNGLLQGRLTCNALMNGTDGLLIRSQTEQVPGFPLEIHDNAIEDHTPPIVPIYIEFGIGRGATSEVEIDMRNNWWGSPLGPYEPDRHADGRGEAVGDNIAFDPWLTSRPACAPRP